MINTFLKRIFPLFVIPLFVLSLCAFTDFVEKVTPPLDRPKGNPDPAVGIVVKFDSTPEAILLDSSESVPFQIRLGIDEKRIGSLRISPLYQKPLKFTLQDDKLGFVADTVYYVSISFNEKTNQWTALNFTPFLPSNWKTKAELQVYLDEWVKRLDEAGWKQYQAKNWIPYQLPTRDKINSKKTYQFWKEDSYEIILQIERYTHASESDIEKFNLRVFVSNKRS